MLAKTWIYHDKHEPIVIDLKDKSKYELDGWYDVSEHLEKIRASRNGSSQEPIEHIEEIEEFEEIEAKEKTEESQKKFTVKTNKRGRPRKKAVTKNG